jgi:hypothetical protein
MQASFNDLVGSADFMASATTLHSMERGELARELSGLTPALEVARATTRMAHEASEAIPTLGGQTICTNCAYDLAIDASDALPTSGSACHTNWCVEGEALEASGTGPTTHYPCFSDEVQGASVAGYSSALRCISDEAQDASGTVPTVTFPCVTDEVQEASGAKVT